MADGDFTFRNRTEQLFAALAVVWPPGDRFDEFNVRITAPRTPALMAALAPLGVKLGYRILRKAALRPQDERNIAEWLKAHAGHEFGGLRLVRERSGWCEFVSVSP